MARGSVISIGDHAWKHKATFGSTEQYFCRRCRNLCTVASARDLKWWGCRPAQPHRADLWCRNRTSDKEYHVWIEAIHFGARLFNVKFRFGKIGGNMLDGTKTPDGPVNHEEAVKILNKVIAGRERRGYVPDPRYNGVAA